MEEEYKRQSELFPSPERFEKVTNVLMKSVFIWIAWLSKVVNSETCINLFMELFFSAFWTPLRVSVPRAVRLLKSRFNYFKRKFNIFGD